MPMQVAVSTRSGSVSVVVPVYNNAGTLAELSTRIMTTFAGRAVQLIVVDDGSTDRSASVLGPPGVTVIRHSRNRGQNEAVFTGLSHAVHPVTCVLDADLDDPPEALARLAAAVDQTPVAFASRPLHRTWSSRLFRQTLRRLFPTLPAYAGLFFAIDSDARTQLLLARRPGDYLPAVIGRLGLATTQVPVVGGAFRHRSRLRGAQRFWYGMVALQSALRVRWR